MQTPSPEDLRDMARKASWEEFVQAATAVPLSPDEALELWDDPDSDVLPDRPELKFDEGPDGRVCLSTPIEPGTLVTQEEYGEWISCDQADLRAVEPALEGER